jgi:hypothetical protein
MMDKFIAIPLERTHLVVLVLALPKYVAHFVTEISIFFSWLSMKRKRNTTTLKRKRNTTTLIRSMTGSLISGWLAAVCRDCINTPASVELRFFSFVLVYSAGLSTRGLGILAAD